MNRNTLRRLSITILVFALIGAMLWPALAFASDAGACYGIADADARTYCLAKAHKEPGGCYSIQRSDMRAQCLAEVRK